jgi:hypothetical protein
MQFLPCSYEKGAKRVVIKAFFEAYAIFGKDF